MMTYEMIGVADENGRTYESKYGTYSKDTGFVFNALVRDFSKAKLCNLLLHEDLWRLKVDKKKMTKEDIEKALGYKIEIVEDEPKKDTNPTKSGSKKKNDFLTFDEFIDKLFKD